MKPYLKNFSGKVRPLCESFGGVRTDCDPVALPSAQAAEMKNISAQSFPVLKTREKRTLLTNAGEGVLFFGCMEGKYLTVIQKTGSVCKWKYFDGGWHDIGTVAESPRYALLYFMDRNILVSSAFETKDGIEKSKSYYAIIGETVSFGTETLMPRSDMADTVNNRICAAYSGSDKVYLGGITDRTVWFDIDDGLEQKVITQNGENAEAICVFGGHLVFFKPHSFAEIYGNTPDSYRMIPVSGSVGCVAHKTVCDAGRLMWLSDDGIVSYGGGTLPKVVSEPIRRYIDKALSSGAGDAAAAADSRRYFICLPQGNGEYINCVMNLKSGEWYVEDNTHFTGFAKLSGEVCAISADGKIYRLFTGDGEPLDWEWKSAVFKIDAEKVLSLHRLHVLCDFSGTFYIKVRINDKESSAAEYQALSAAGAARRVLTINLHPRLFSESDSFQIILGGNGSASVYSVGASLRAKKKTYM